MNSSSPRKRILYCESNQDGTIGGSYFSLLYLVAGLNKTEFEPIVVFYTDNGLIPRFKAAGVDTRVIAPPSPVHIVPEQHRSSPLWQPIQLVQKAINFCQYFILSTLRLILMLRREEVQLVHLNNSVLRSHNFMIACLLLGIPCVTHERGINTTYTRSSKLLGRSLEQIICISNYVRDCVKSGGFPEEKLSVVYNGLAADEFEAKTDPKEIRRSLAIPNTARAIGMTGNIKFWKGQHVLIQAIAKVSANHPDIYCVIVGDVSNADIDYNRNLQEEIRELGVQTRIIFTGYQTDVASYMNAMDIVVHASVDPEPFGRVLLEAMALKKPLVASRDGAVPEIVLDNECGLLFEPGDPSDLAKKLDQILSSPDLGRELGARGYQRLNDYFDITKNIKKIENLYRTILS